MSPSAAPSAPTSRRLTACPTAYPSNARSGCRTAGSHCSSALLPCLISWFRCSCCCRAIGAPSRARSSPRSGPWTVCARPIRKTAGRSTPTSSSSSPIRTSSPSCRSAARLPSTLTGTAKITARITSGKPSSLRNYPQCCTTDTAPTAPAVFSACRWVALLPSTWLNTVPTCSTSLAPSPATWTPPAPECSWVFRAL